MRRILTIVALVAGLSALGSSSAQAQDYFHHGGHAIHGHQGSHAPGGYARGGYATGGYGHQSVQSYPQYQPVPAYSAQSYGYGANRSFQPNYQSYSVQPYSPSYTPSHAPSYSNNGYGTHGGIHLDIGRLHVLGIGGHHH